MLVRLKFLGWGVAAFVAFGIAAVAQPPLAPAVPLVSSGTATGVDRLALTAAQRAHDLGLLTVAASQYRALRETAGVDRPAISLALATVLLDAGQGAEAQRVLDEIAAPRGSAWRLRVGLAALQQGDRPLAQSSWDATNPEELPPGDLAWYWFLAGALYDTASPQDISKANEYYVKAEQAAPTALARARFQLAAEQVRLWGLGVPEAPVLEQARRNYEQWQGRTEGYRYAQVYAVLLAKANRAADAIQFLQRQVLQTLPAAERHWRDEFNLLLGLIGDRGANPAGRAALAQLLESGANAERQRQALHLLFAASQTDSGRGQLTSQLTRLITAQPPHQIRDALLFYRAQLSLTDRKFALAEDDANTFVRDFPGSPLRPHAFGILTQSAWEQRRYRMAAENARRAREALGAVVPNAPETQRPGLARLRAELGVLEAEAWYRAADFRSSADAYATVLREHGEGLPAERVGEVMFQRVLAETKTNPAAAGAVLDQLSGAANFDLESRWRAEWSLARALQVDGQTAQAYDRVNRLLSATGAAAESLAPELRARMAWLQARLAFDAGRPEQAVNLGTQLLASLGPVPERLRAEIASTTVLLQARAQFALGREAEALATLERLREQHKASEAAVYSFLVEADHFERQDKIDDARKILTRLVSDKTYENNPYVPYALFQLAMLSERLGQPNNLEEANKRIEDLVNRPIAAGENDLIFAARLKQGDILRKLNQFPQAQQAYESLVNRYPQRRDVVFAQLALAQTHNAQSSADPSHADIAQLKFEELRDRVDAPLDVRVEAGYNLGALLLRRGKTEQAAVVWWRDVVTPFLIEAPAPLEPTATRRHWLARTLLELGALQEQLGRLDEAKAAYELLLRSGLGHGQALARAALERLGVPAERLGAR